MFPFSRRLTTWILAAWFAAVAGIGEGWHAVPGNGHWVELPNGSCVYVGRLPWSSQDCLVRDAKASFDRGQRDSLSLKDEADCAICRASGQDRGQDASLGALSSVLLAQDAPILDSILVCTPVVRAFNARAPPQA
jgi:hypothetical protein